MRVTRRLLQSVKLSYDLLSPTCRSHDAKQSVVIMHGFLGNKNNNRTLGRKLVEALQRPVYLVDMRNHGSSPRTAEFNYKAMSEDIFQFIRDHRLEKPLLLGHSMGAKVGMTCALGDPKHKLVSQLVCIENVPVCTQPNGKFAEYITWLLRITQQSKIKTLAQADAYLAQFESDEKIRQFLLSSTLQRRPPGGQGPTTPAFEPKIPLAQLRESLLRGEVSGWTHDPRRERFTGPTLFIRGTLSEYIADEYIPTIGLFFPRFQLEDVKGAGHFVNAEQPDTCAELIKRFVESD
ncbi:Imo32p KNAG_0D03910 [Huiozyma naganishii CBS 8797]|uniref:AB hydrolase-1 domain-containing protein n=1 Tax=Huiozyma naganishii (strain ATCC MYA-139 / BCRC 22969 / CBS 8797 / KCTC 17520 / NBRC 10181 / NCYC 3082 / Yp74L-3) TaxID=1071383 RepID=J7RYB8_HUIN7|nr:hypothetical protein KNAG_0D03910 [Kazachstania naganishii CBS 8797]CCK70137.1 hypothetical protein KNAG_0D03910 [Kazachstania naganishii CBS 8797]